MSAYPSRKVAVTSLALFVGVQVATPSIAEDPKSKGSEPDKQVAGMSIVGNDESPKSLVIVPWKGSDLGDGVDVSRRLAQDRSPVDRAVFGRSLDFYEIRTGKK
jgi:hypothetical protein